MPEPTKRFLLHTSARNQDFFGMVKELVSQANALTEQGCEIMAILSGGYNPVLVMSNTKPPSGQEFVGSVIYWRPIS